MAAIHIVPVEHAEETVQKFLDYVEYLTANPVAFEKYKNAKIALKNEKYGPYKMKKMKSVLDLSGEIADWKKQKKKN